MMCTHENKQEKLIFIAVIDMNDQLQPLKKHKESYERISKVIFATLKAGGEGDNSG